MKELIIGIDASNIRSGGGLTHLVELLLSANPYKNNFDKIVVWGSQPTLNRIVNQEWLIKRTDSVLERNFLWRFLWQWKKLPRLAMNENCSLLFIPGGSFLSKFKPIVTMSQNLLPFEWRELIRYGVSPFMFKLLLLRFSQSISFKNADGTIFLTKYAQDTVLAITGKLSGMNEIIPHGIDSRFFVKPREQRKITDCYTSDPLKLIYISTVEPYKHQCNVVEAVCKLQHEGLPVSLDLYGSANPSYLKKLESSINNCDSDNDFINYHGVAEYDDIHHLYLESDIGVFASTCENMPIILLEMMASGLPVVCSNKEPMLGILGDAGVYFNPEDVESISSALLKLANDSVLRSVIANETYVLAKKYSWNECTDKTFEFLSKIMKF